MKKVLSPAKKFAGSLRIPPDKSITHRALILSSLAQGTSTIQSPLKSADCLSTARCLEELGCKIFKGKNEWRVKGQGLWGFRVPSGPLNCGNSGTSMRLLAGILAAQPFSTELIGDESLSKRPMDRIAFPLRQMGATVVLKEEKYAPIKIRGTKNLKSLYWKNPVASAQVKSCVLLAGLHTKGETIFEEPSLSRDHTERMLKVCGVDIEQVASPQKGRVVRLKGPVNIKPLKWVIPGDISSAAFFMVGAVLKENSEVTLKGVNLNPTRTGLLDALQKMGAAIQILNRDEVSGEPIGDLVIHGHAPQHPMTFDPSDLPRLIDEIPLLAILATQAQGTTYLKNIGELRLKETDRISAIAQNLKAMGARVREVNNGLVIKGPTPLKGAFLQSFLDHRIAMAFAIAAMIAQGPTTIKDSEVVSISYPEFWENLAQLSQ